MNRFRHFLEDWAAPCIYLATLFVVLFLQFGCRGVSPERQAYRATAATITTANAALDVWFSYVNAENLRLENLRTSDPGAFMDRRRALVISEGKVASAWDTYVAAQKAIIIGASALGPGEAPTNADLKTLEAELIALVQSLTK